MLDSILQRCLSFRFGVPLIAAATCGMLAGPTFAQSAGRVETLGGAPVAGYVEGVTGSSRFNTPAGLAVRGDGKLFIADYNNNAIRTLRLSDSRTATFAPGNKPVAVVFDHATNLFVANQGNGTITKFDYFGNLRSTLRPALTGGAMTAMAMDRDDNLYIAQVNGIVTRVNAQGFVDATLAAPAGSTHQFQGVAVADDGSIYVSDSAAQVIWKFAGIGSGAELFAGTLNAPGRLDGEIGFGRLNRPHQIALGPNNSIVIADRGNHQIRVASCAGVLTTLYGIDSSEWFILQSPEVFPGWYDGAPEYAELREPVGVTADQAGNVYDTEDYYHLVRAASGLAFPPACNTGGGPVDTNAVPAPILQPNSGFYPNGVTISITASNSPAGFPRGAHIYYTLDGSEPTKASTEVPIGNDGRAILELQGPVDLAGLRVRVFVGDNSSPIASASPTQVPTPVISPDSGYYPMGAIITVTSTNRPAPFPDGTLLYYTTDGTEPTTNSTALLHDSNSGSISWNVPQRDLRSLKVKAFLGPNAGRTASGRAVSFPADPGIQGEIGVPPARNGFNAGIGSFYVLPIVANLRDNQTLRSLQFVVELTARSGAPRLERTDVQVLPISTNDFISVQAASFLPPDNTIPTAANGVNTLGIAYVGTNSGFNVSGGYATVAMLGIQFRAGDALGNTADEGDEYTIRVRSISGTSDGVQQLLPLKPMADRTIRLKNIKFQEGDTAPAYWYNAGDFGNQFLENADVNNAVYAAFGFRRPFPRSDAFAAMDVYRIGVLENVVEYNDAATILRRAFGLESPEVYRVRDAEGQWESSTDPLQPPPAPPAALTVAEAQAWSRDAVIYGGNVDRVDGFTWVDVPVYMKVRSGRFVSGMQFVADVIGQNGAPAIESISFVPSPGLPTPQWFGNSVPNVGTFPNTVYARWDNIDPGITGTVQLGSIRFRLPSTVLGGQSYAVIFRETGGASIDWQTGALRGLLFESIRGGVWPYISHAASPQPSDEWKVQFFGSASNSAADAELDADGDGFTNYEEYLTGTDPNSNNWHVKADHGQVTFRWVGQANKGYVVEQTSDFKGWNAVTSRITGQDAFLEYNETAPAAGARFYRLRVE